jgi:hypothetical protein
MKVSKLAVTAVSAAALGATSAWASPPEVEAPDGFERPGPVRQSIERMQETLADAADGNWKAQRGAGICEDAARRLRDYVTSQAYTAGLGEKIWRECHKAYGDVE